MSEIETAIVSISKMRTLSYREIKNLFQVLTLHKFWSPVLNLWLHPGPTSGGPGFAATLNTQMCKRIVGITQL